MAEEQEDSSSGKKHRIIHWNPDIGNPPEKRRWTLLRVLAGLEVIRSIRDMGIVTRRPIVVTHWTNEEGARFAPAMLASGVFAGVLTEDYANSRTDAEGKLFGDELDRIGWRGDEVPGERRIHAMFEYHIEPMLKAARA